MKKKEQPISDEILCGEYKSVFRYVMSLCRNETESEDITQEAFLRAIKHSDSFMQGSSLYTWLCTIARNIWLAVKQGLYLGDGLRAQHYRRRNRRRRGALLEF